jgi:hypothetical protein
MLHTRPSLGNSTPRQLGRMQDQTFESVGCQPMLLLLATAARDLNLDGLALALSLSAKIDTYALAAAMPDHHDFLHFACHL